MPKSGEAFWWSLFSVGGVVAALLVPIHIALTGLAVPLGWVPIQPSAYERMLSLVSHPIIRLYLFLMISLPFFHCAHRFRHTLYDLGFRRNKTAVAVLCYTLAVTGTVAAGIILVAIH